MNWVETKLDQFLRRKRWFTIVHMLETCSPSIPAPVETKGFKRVFFLVDATRNK